MTAAVVGPFGHRLQEFVGVTVGTDGDQEIFAPNGLGDFVDLPYVFGPHQQKSTVPHHQIDHRRSPCGTLRLEEADKGYRESGSILILP